MKKLLISFFGLMIMVGCDYAKPTDIDKLEEENNQLRQEISSLEEEISSLADTASRLDTEIGSLSDIVDKNAENIEKFDIIIGLGRSIFKGILEKNFIITETLKLNEEEGHIYLFTIETEEALLRIELDFEDNGLFILMKKIDSGWIQIEYVDQNESSERSEYDDYSYFEESVSAGEYAIIVYSLFDWEQEEDNYRLAIEW